MYSRWVFIYIPVFIVFYLYCTHLLTVSIISHKIRRDTSQVRKKSPLNRISWHCAFVKPAERATQGVRPHVHPGLQLMMKCGYTIRPCHKYHREPRCKQQRKPSDEQRARGNPVPSLGNVSVTLKVLELSLWRKRWRVQLPAREVSSAVCPALLYPPSPCEGLLGSPLPLTPSEAPVAHCPLPSSPWFRWKHLPSLAPRPPPPPTHTHLGKQVASLGRRGQGGPASWVQTCPLMGPGKQGELRVRPEPPPQTLSPPPQGPQPQRFPIRDHISNIKTVQLYFFTFFI